MELTRRGSRCGQKSAQTPFATVPKLVPDFGTNCSLTDRPEQDLEKQDRRLRMGLRKLGREGMGKGRGIGGRSISGGSDRRGGADQSGTRMPATLNY